MLLRTAAVLSWTLGLGFGIPCAYGAWYLARQGQVWTLLGYPTYGGGSFTKAAIVTTVPLLMTFLLVCIVELGVGWLLWAQQPGGIMVALAVLPLELVFWIGFSLPYALLLGAVRTVLVLVSWWAAARSGA